MSEAPPIGSIRLYDNATPDLSAGLYRVTSSLQVAKTSGAGLPAPAAQASHVRVAGPRFVLDPGDIAARHPPASARGAFGDRLPHVTLGRRTLPWERRLAAADGTPWLAVVLVATDQAELATGALKALLPAGVVSTMEGLDPIAGDPPVTVLKVKDLATFRAVLPSRRDVGLLCHVRQVNLADSAQAGTDDDGWFAIVTANRLPLPAAGTATKEYLACLVSLEARADVWTVPDGQAAPPLIVLHSWTFTTAGEGGTFEHLAARLDIGLFGAPLEGGTAPVDTAGTVGLSRVDRTGNAMAVRYRGPLLGVATGQPLGGPADDVSAVAAYELGRLLGAADARFLRELVAWHRAGETRARAALVGRDLAVALATRPRRSAAGRVASASAALSTGDVRAALAKRLTRLGGRPANLWQVHPAGPRAVAALKRAARAAKRAGKRRRPSRRGKGPRS